MHVRCSIKCMFSYGTYANSGLSTEALNVYKEMCENDVAFDKYTFTFTLKACSVIKNETTGRVIHGHVVKTGFVYNVALLKTKQLLL
ncbi:putative tetratricopeptide-like helical domain superfamily [Helianthus annuus]|nr:putative tetratricopeptide-like helical domain superfamily [Helianthus annuus]